MQSFCQCKPQIFAFPKLTAPLPTCNLAMQPHQAPCVVSTAGRLKEKSFDPYTSVSTLQSAWISRASEKQRRGRAGRCQEGLAFHCYSSVRSQALAELQLPELMRSPLDELCLQVGCHVCQQSGQAVPAGGARCLCVWGAICFSNWGDLCLRVEHAISACGAPYVTAVGARCACEWARCLCASATA